jgi:hypothetical protein
MRYLLLQSDAQRGHEIRIPGLGDVKNDINVAAVLVRETT